MPHLATKVAAVRPFVWSIKSLIVFIVEDHTKWSVGGNVCQN